MAGDGDDGMSGYGVPAGELAVVHTAGPDDAMLQALLSARRYWQAKGLNLNMLVMDEYGNGTAVEQGLLVRRTEEGRNAALSSSIRFV